jgi:hypothetical protein
MIHIFKYENSIYIIMSKDVEQERERCKAMGLANRGKVASAETKAKMSATRKGRPHSKKHSEAIGKALKGRVFTEEWRAKLSLAASNRKVSQETRKRMSETRSGEQNGFYGRQHDPESRKIMSEKAMGREQTYEALVKNTEAQLGGMWYGNVRYPTRIVCVKWDDVNVRVHAFFKNRCIVCGKTKEPGKLAPSGHHVFYETKSCCWYDTEDGIYYTNLNAKDHKERDYCIGDNPNYFVLLCQSCHGKSNGTFANRKKWADLLKEIVDEQYDGKCYYTKEEFKTLKEMGSI